MDCYDMPRAAHWGKCFSHGCCAGPGACCAEGQLLGRLGAVVGAGCRGGMGMPSTFKKGRGLELGIWIAAGIVLSFWRCCSAPRASSSGLRFCGRKKSGRMRNMRKWEFHLEPLSGTDAEAQSWIHQHTAEHVSMVSFDGLKLSALYAFRRRPRSPRAP